MSVGLLLVTHAGVGRTLLSVATGAMHGCALMVRCLDVAANDEPELLWEQGNQLLAELDSGDGVLILTDAYGSTPSNIACSLYRNQRTAVVAGLNLPMLLRILNYSELTLPELEQKALSGGRDGVLSPGCESSSS